MEQAKKYLKTIEEVSDALAAGKILYSKYGHKVWKDKNGFIVSEYNGCSRAVGSLVDVEMEHYILESKPLEPKPLEVKLWHLYEDEGGRKVFIYEMNKTIYPFSGINFDKDFVFHYNIKGKAMEDDIKLVKELADLSKYFEKEPDNAKND